MNLRQYLSLIQKSIQLKSADDMLKLLPFENLYQTFSGTILQDIQDVPEVF